MLWEANLPHHEVHGWDAGASPRAPSRVWFASRDISVRLVFNRLELLKELLPGHTALPVAERLLMGGPALETVRFPDITLSEGALSEDPSSPTRSLLVGSPSGEGFPAATQELGSLETLVAVAPTAMATPSTPVVDLTNVTTTRGSSLGSLHALVIEFCASVCTSAQPPVIPAKLRVHRVKIPPQG